jgi:hypothetical protein
MRTKTLSVATLVDLLESAVRDLARLSSAVAEFQAAVRSASDDDLVMTPDQRELIRDLAYDLDYFEPDASLRAESSSYFGADGAIDEIRQALEKLRA